MTLEPIARQVSSRIAFPRGFAALRLSIAPVLAWVLGVILFLPTGFVSSFIRERADPIRAPVDYPMMAQLLFLFAVLFRQYAVVPPRWVECARSRLPTPEPIESR